MLLTLLVELDEEGLVARTNRVGDGSLQEPPVVTIGRRSREGEARDEGFGFGQKPTTQVLISVPVYVVAAPKVVGSGVVNVSERY